MRNKKKSVQHFPVRRCIAVIMQASLGCTLFLSHGCATSKNLPRIEAHYYGQCIRPLARMQELDSRLAQTTGQYALGGALAGAVIGLMVTASNPYALPLGLGVGAAAGLAAGAAVGYTFAKLDQIADEDTRFASIRVTANQDLSKANRLQLYSYECLICYMQEFEKLKAAYESGNMLKNEYQVRFQEIFSALNALGEIIGKMDQEIVRTEREFTDSLAKSGKTTVVSNPVAHTPPRTHLLSRISEKRARIQNAQLKNDADLTKMLDECAGKVHPPKQNPSRIQEDYGKGYAETRQEIKDLRATHSEALSIMKDAALEAGIDMV